MQRLKKVDDTVFRKRRISGDIILLKSIIPVTADLLYSGRFRRTRVRILPAKSSGFLSPDLVHGKL